MRKADHPRFRNLSSPDEARIRDGMVRISKRPDYDQGASRWNQSHHAVDLFGLKALLKIHIRRDGGKYFQKHGLTGAGRIDRDLLRKPKIHTRKMSRRFGEYTSNPCSGTILWFNDYGWKSGIQIESLEIISKHSHGLKTEDR